MGKSKFVYFEKQAKDLSNTRGVTVKAVLVGLIVVVFINVWTTHTEMYVRGSRLTLAHFPLALFAVLLGVLALNRWLRLSVQELLVVISMGLVGAVIPVEGVVGFLVGIISSFHYFASPENQWADYLLPFLPTWLIPQGSPAIWIQFFESIGLERGIPWSMWALPLFWWSVFILATLWVTACVMVILRRQWQDHERLVYPLANVAMQMVNMEDHEGRPLLRGRLFWAGASLPFAILVWEALSWFSSVPLPFTGIYGYRPFTIFKGAIPLVVNPFQFYSIGFAYFANTEVLFSIWFFFLVHVSISAVFARFGYSMGGVGGDQFSAEPAPTSWIGFGALCFMVFWGFYVARQHLSGVFRKAFYSDPDVDDTTEMLSYRMAVWSGLLGLFFMLFWLRASGMTLFEASLFLFASFVIYVGMARIVSETGVLYTWGTLSPQSFVFSAVGTEAMAGSSAVALLLSYSQINYLRGLFGPALAHVARFGSVMGGNRKHLLRSVLVGAAFALVFAFWFMLELCYDNGAYNTFGWPRFFNGNPKGIFSDTMSKVRNPFPMDWERLTFTGAGAVLMALLTALRTRLIWWRLHPVGFVMSAMINTQHLALPVFIAWSVKSMLLSAGGVQLYRRAIPLFIGLIVGYVVGVTVCSVVDMIWFPGQGHLVHDW
jgi:hypothetical protein